ncbi:MULTISPECIES: recombinase family protein [Komagataeibacter]|uniref:recombinase family protein n=1 Tax=Komagataeibacter TaxID=1434011 RepID=UPI00038008A0|nr:MULTISPECIES: recombinase family protein [Komagataeibacter]GBQ38167.1 DNA resolvase [Komagataeibacter europaeus LMG 18890]
MLIGYARTSTTDQVAGLEGQVRELKAKGCAKVYAEQISATSARRPELTACMDNLRAGDVLVVAKPDRLARSTADLLALVKDIEAKDAALLILSMGGQELDTRNPTSKLMLTMLAAVAEFERDLMKERQAEGIAKAKADGRYKGRKPLAESIRKQVMERHQAGMGATAIARELDISRMTVYRITEK